VTFLASSKDIFWPAQAGKRTRVINKIQALLLGRVFILDLEEISFRINFSGVIAEDPLKILILILLD
jgi:hypothetical protein